MGGGSLSVNGDDGDDQPTDDHLTGTLIRAPTSPSASQHRSLSSLASRLFSLPKIVYAVYALSMINMLALMAFQPVLLLYLTLQGWSSKEHLWFFGLLNTLGSALPVGFNPLLAALVPVLGTRNTMVGATLLALAGYLLMLLVPLKAVFAVAFSLTYLLQCLRRTVHQQIIIRNTSPEERMRAMGWAPLATSVGAMLGAPVLMLCNLAHAATAPHRLGHHLDFDRFTVLFIVLVGILALTELFMLVVFPAGDGRAPPSASASSSSSSSSSKNSSRQNGGLLHGLRRRLRGETEASESLSKPLLPMAGADTVTAAANDGPLETKSPAPEPSPPNPPPSPSPWEGPFTYTDHRGRLQHDHTQRAVGRFVVLFSLLILTMNVSVGFYMVSFQPILVHHFNYDSHQLARVALIYSAVACVPPLVMVVLAAKLKVGARSIMYGGMVLKFLGMFIYAWPPGHLWQIVLGYVLILKGAIFVLTALLTLFSQLLAARTASMHIGILTGINALGSAIGNMTGSSFVLHFYGKYSFLVFGAGAAVAVALLLVPSIFHSMDLAGPLARTLGADHPPKDSNGDGPTEPDSAQDDAEA